MGIPDWLVVSIVASVVLTVFANIALRWRPRGGVHHDDGLRDLGDRNGVAPPTGGERSDVGPGVRIVVPWRLMIVISLVLTVGVNLVLRSR